MNNELQLPARAATFGEKVAIEDAGQSYRYDQLLETSRRVASGLLAGKPDLDESRVAFLLPSSFSYVATQWGIWQAGGVAVPISPSSADPEIDYLLSDSQAAVAVTIPDWIHRLEPLCQRHGIQLRTWPLLSEEAPQSLPSVDSHRRAMILYTSGTTSRPKGVVTTHANIEAQITALVEAWQWRSTDHIPLFLPLHHIHGIINVLSCGLWSGAVVDIHRIFDLSRILACCAEQRYTLFMAVPTIYVKLLQAFQSADPEQQARWRAGFAKMRLMVSGSAALPTSVHQNWTQWTGQTLLERYGMTEIGMALSHPLEGERRPGSVGVPLPRVEVRLVTEANELVDEEGIPGEIQVRGPSVFLEYWNQPEVTKQSFHGDWFRTGDMAVREKGQYRIMGRVSVDIIKSGGYKLSALEIEASLLEHPSIAECAVVGIEDETWGEAVAAAVVTRGDEPLELSDLRDWCGGRLAKYKIPKRLLLVSSLPRNAMGKITKPAVKQLFE